MELRRVKLFRRGSCIEPNRGCIGIHKTMKNSPLWLLLAIGFPSWAGAVVVQAQITPADGIVTIGQTVRMVIEVTNDSDAAIPGITLISSNQINGLSGPLEVPPCRLILNQVSPPQSPIAYGLAWDVVDLEPHERRFCDITFRVLTLPKGQIPIFLKVFPGPLMLVATFRTKPIVAVPAMNWAGYLVLLLASVLVAKQFKSRNHT